MLHNEMKTAIAKKEQITILTTYGETIQGTPEALTDRVKLRRNDGVVYVPVKDIEYVSRLITLKRKTDPTSD